MAVVSLLAGATTNTGATVASETGAASTSCRVAYATNPVLTAPSYSGAVVTDATGYAKFDLTGLTAGQKYYYGIEVGGILDPAIGSFRTHPAAAGQPCSFTIAHASCAQGDTGSGTPWTPSNHKVFAAIAARDPLMFLMTGDMHYRHAGTTGQYQTAIRQAIGTANAKLLYSGVATNYMYDDHDYGGDNSDSTWVGRAAIAGVYRQAIPHYPLAGSGAAYQAFTVGRWPVVVTDLRYERSPDTDTDNSSKTMLGATQKTWLKAQWLANKNAPAQFWVNTQVWNDDNTVSGIDADKDHWGAFATERKELADYCAANGITNIVQLTGDMHALGLDRACDYSTAGTAPMRIWCGSSLDSLPVVRGSNWDQYQIGRGQYGTVTVTDHTTWATVDWKGWGVDPTTGAETLVMADSVLVGDPPPALTTGLYVVNTGSGFAVPVVGGVKQAVHVA